MRKPHVGYGVTFVMESGPRAGEGRPGLVVRVNEDGTVNLQVFTDTPVVGAQSGDWRPPMFHVRGVKYSEGKEFGTWHFEDF